MIDRVVKQTRLGRGLCTVMYNCGRWSGQVAEQIRSPVW